MRPRNWIGGGSARPAHEACQLRCRVPMTTSSSVPIEVHVSLDGRTNLTNEIYRQLRAAILDGRLARGDRLPPSRELATRLAVSRTTVMDVYDRLLSEGFTDARPGSGTFVSAELMAPLRRRAPISGALRPRPIWESIRIPTALDRSAEFDFRVGVPDARHFPFDAWRRLEARAWAPSAIGKGFYGDPAGDRGLREAIARHITVARGVRARPDDVVVTNGTQQAVDVVARALLRPGDVVAVEDPGYPSPRRLLSSLGLRVVGVPVDAEGIVVAALPPDARLLFVSPSHQFPLGTAMSLRRRMALTAWAEEHDAAIIEDDYDSEFRLGGRPIEPLQMLDRTGRAIYVGSFSKTLLAQLRIGFVVVPESIRHAVTAAKYVADWHTALPAQRSLAAFIDDGSFARHVRRMRTIYRERHDRIAAILRRDFADELRLLPAAAGVHVSALAVRHSVDEVTAIVRRARAARVAVHELATFAVGEDRRAGLLLGYGAIATEDIDEGLQRLRVSFDGGGEDD